ITQPTINLGSIPIKRNIILGRQQISYTQYQKLRLGNVILLSEINFDAQGNGCLNLGSFAIQLSYAHNNVLFQEWKTKMEDKKDYTDDWNLDEYIQSEEQELNEEDTDDSEEYEQDIQESDNQEENITQETEEVETVKTVHPFANVPINLTFSLGQMNLPIEQIMQLQQGTILNLHKNTPAQVEIYANGKLIGNGEIIEIDEQIGVQILNLD
ncbi:MAG: type III secretion system cytoplasmic ring protein SctQ, partial [Chitinophagaceae bacterium]